MATYWENSCSFGLRYVLWYKYLIVSLVFSQFGFWSGNLFLIAPFPDLCLLVPFYYVPGGHGSHVSDNRDRNGITGTGYANVPDRDNCGHRGKCFDSLKICHGTHGGNEKRNGS